MLPINFNVQGLSNEQVSATREKWGYNRLSYKKENGFFDTVISLAKEPMLVLLFVAYAIYYKRRYREWYFPCCRYHGYKGEGTTTTPFDIVVLNDLDRFHLIGVVIDRLPHLGSTGAYIKQYLRNQLLDHKAYIEMHGEDMPEILNWKWTLN